MELTFIGTGNAFAPTRYYSSFLADGRYLFDAPPTLIPHLNKLRKNPLDIEVIFISHFHGDHYYGLPFLLLEFAERTPRTKELTIVGPPGVAKRVEAATELAFPNVFRKKTRGYPLNFIEAKNERKAEANGCTFTSYRVQHVPGLECFAFRAEVGGKTVAYSGDTMMCDALVPLADEADAFVVECSCWHETCGVHLSPPEILRLRTQISQRTRFILTHMGAGEAPREITDAGIFVAEDLRTITI